LCARLDQGFWLEQAIFQTLQVWRAIDPTRRRIHFWRDRSGREVDFVLERDSALVAIEVKASSQASPRDADGIVAFGEHLPSRKKLRRGVVLHAGQARPLRENVVALPWGWMFPTGKS
jgi:predicted AAA+ superfamily ATPase